MDLVSLPRNPVPSGATVGSLPGWDGAPLRYARWEATRSPRRGTVCLFGGRGEFIEKYFETVADLRRRGFAVATMDWRGQGGSHRPLANPMKGHIRAFSEYDRDLALFMTTVVLPDCPPPFVALAHSMGGNILLRNASAPGSWFTRMVLSAPMIVINDAVTGGTQRAARAYAELWCALGFAHAYVRGGSDKPEECDRFEGNVLTGDTERWGRNRAVIEAAPALGLGSPTIGWLRAAERSSGRLSAPGYTSRVQVPLLLFAAGKDEVVSTRAIESFGSGLKVGSHILLMGSRHEILQETDDVRRRFWAAFDAYLGVEDAAA